MKLDEAISIDKELLHQYPASPCPKVNAALSLSIEAMEAILEWRSHLGSVGCLPLPSETKEYCKLCGLAHTDIECPDRGREK